MPDIIAGNEYPSFRRFLKDGEYAKQNIQVQPPYCVQLELALQVAPARYVLIDLADYTNYPHEQGNALIIKNIDIWTLGNPASAVIQEAKIGLLTENDAVDGSVYFFTSSINAPGAAVPVPRFFDYLVGTGGLDLSIQANKPKYFASNVSELNNVNWKNTVNLTSPIGTSNPTPGSLVMLTEQILAGAGGQYISVTVLYDIVRA